ncbi:hypothetical protein NDU88_005862 [Pleurodeles waltl]|uniref:Uncharacterized protein n=1 Tax=Pleurodeles waltl TaxID=8319 RepID=A0AAV7ME84_PLEWA|nr:hypothetical protein NDU88_005862 [Pleurodeles waltl]
MAVTCFTRSRCRLPPIRDDFRGTQTSKTASGKRPGVLERQTRKKAQDRGNPQERSDDQADCSDQHSRHPTQPVDHSDGCGFSSPGPEDQGRKKQQSGHALGRAWPWQDEEDRGNPRERSYDQADCSNQHSRHPTRPADHSDDGGFSSPGLGDQEVAKPKIWPRSGESVALAGTVPQWAAIPFVRY